MIGSIGPAEIILWMYYLLITGLLFFGARWAHRRSIKADFGLPFTWFYFYTYIRLPLNILASLVVLISARNEFDLMAGLVVIGLQATALVGLSRFRRWALSVNVLVLLGDWYAWYSKTTSQEASGAVRLITGALILLIWLVPNLLYFEKRRRFFAGPARPEVPENTPASNGERLGEKGQA